MTLIRGESRIASSMSDGYIFFGVRASSQSCKRHPSCPAGQFPFGPARQCGFRDITNTGVRDGKVSNRVSSPARLPREGARKLVRTTTCPVQVNLADSHRADVADSQAADGGDVAGNAVGLPSPVADAVLASLDVVQAVDEYSGEILLREFRRELRFVPCQDYLEKQAEINGRMRRILVKWLARVHSEHKLHRSSLFLAVGIVDRYLSKRQVPRRQFQLLGACSLLIASKVEDTEPPVIPKLVFLGAGEYNEGDMKLMERNILRALEFAVTVPTVADFLPHFQAASQARSNLGQDAVRPCMPALVPFVWRKGSPSVDDTRRNKLSWRLAEMALADGYMVHYPPSCLAASALLLSSRLSNQHPAWPEVTAELSGYPEVALAPCVGDLQAMHSASLRSSFEAGRGHR